MDGIGVAACPSAGERDSSHSIANAVMDHRAKRTGDLEQRVYEKQKLHFPKFQCKNMSNGAQTGEDRTHVLRVRREPEGVITIESLAE